MQAIADLAEHSGTGRKTRNKTNKFLSFFYVMLMGNLMADTTKTTTQRPAPVPARKDAPAPQPAPAPKPVEKRTDQK